MQHLPKTPATWHSVLNVDFTAATAVTITADGNYVIGGTTFIFSNYAGLDSSAYQWAIVNGTGLVTRPNDATTDYVAGTAPMLECAVPGLIPGMPVRARLRVASAGAVASAIDLVMGLKWGSSGTRPWAVAVGSIASGAASCSLVALHRSSGGTSGFISFGVDIAAGIGAGLQDVLALQMPLGAAPLLPAIVGIGDFADGGWGLAAVATIRQLYNDAAAGRKDDLDTTMPAESAARLVICPQFSTDTGATRALTISGIVVDAYY